METNAGSISVVFVPAVEQDYDAFFKLIQEESASYLEKTLEIMHSSWEEFARLTRTVGQVYRICQASMPVGYLWIEQREMVLHLHGLFIESQCQGKGYGKAIMQMLADQYRDRVEAIELGVHISNEKAIRLYQRAGFQTVKRREDVGFLIMQLGLSGGGRVAN